MLIDQPKAQRSEDTLPEELILAFLKDKNLTQANALEIKQFSGGASNLTYQLETADFTGILRCPPKGTKAKGAHDMKREYKIIEALQNHYPVPKTYIFCEDESIIGREFYLMERLIGIIPRANMPKELVLSEEETRKLCLNVIDKLIELHQIDIKKTGLDDFGKGLGYVERQVEGWSKRYEKAKTWNVPSFKGVMNWLEKNKPKIERSCFVHNDYRFDNVVLDSKNSINIIGVLDWEMATVGDPLMDLGNSIAYWVQADDDFVMKKMRRQPTHLAGMLTRKEVIDYYCKKMNFSVEEFKFYEIYGLFRLAVIIQQIYYRYHHKQTSNVAFKNFWLFVHYLHWRCKQNI